MYVVLIKFILKYLSVYKTFVFAVHIITVRWCSKVFYLLLFYNYKAFLKKSHRARLRFEK